jgi:hypothetical protein
MSQLNTVLSHMVVLLTAATLAGVLARRRLRLCWSFAPFLAAVLIGNRLVTWWPETFYTRSFWTLKEAVYSVLILGVALEMAFLIFHQRFAGAAPRVRLTLFAILGVTVLSLVGVTAPGSYRTSLNDLIPRVYLGAFWLFCTTALLAVSYRLPLHEYHRALVLGFSAYLVPSSLLLNGIGRWSEGVDYMLRTADQVASAAVFVYWCWAAWQRERVPEASPEVVRVLQPWR